MRSSSKIQIGSSRMLRHEAIVRVIRARAVHTQEELAQLLGKEGFDVTQTTLSRDLAENWGDSCTSARRRGLRNSRFNKMIRAAVRHGQHRDFSDRFAKMDRWSWSQRSRVALRRSPRVIDLARMNEQLGYAQATTPYRQHPPQK